MTAACGSPKNATDKTFTYEEMSITLTDAFEEKNFEGYSVTYDSSQAAVFVLREAKDLLGEEITFDDYTELVMQANASRGFVDLSDVTKKDGLVCFDYRFTNTEQGIEYRYFTTLHESADAFWMVQFVTPTELYDKYVDTFVKWTKTVTFSR